MMLTTIKKVLLDESGATMVEYAFMLMLIAVVCVGVVTAIGATTAAKYDQVVARWP